VLGGVLSRPAGAGERWSAGRGGRVGGGEARSAWPLLTPSGLLVALPERPGAGSPQRVHERGKPFLATCTATVHGVEGTTVQQERKPERWPRAVSAVEWRARQRMTGLEGAPVSVTAGAGRQAKCPLLSGCRGLIPPDVCRSLRGAFLHSFPGEKPPRIRAGHTVILAEILAPMKAEMGAVIRPSGPGKFPLPPSQEHNPPSPGNAAS
jgi:hypothetical protein